ncbi:hypothetical protein CCR75_006837 [Bremia lactucae]|uniref:GPI transamidase component PIG-S n=1 Tax=Bremia lactucae TaxID=4779 RepID=A0A976NZL0_BRELC|nr:hypothetical protein CCR75_006837 [Bremia lactucae]
MAGTRLQIVGAFVLFVLLAAPVAWHLTLVKRVDLPYLRIQQLSWDASRFGVPDKFEVDVYSLGSEASLSALSSSASTIVYVPRSIQLNAEQEHLLQEAYKSGLQATDDVLKTLVTRDSKRFSLVLVCNENAAISASVLAVGKYRHAWSPQCQVSEGDGVHLAMERLLQRYVYPAKDTQNYNSSTGVKLARRALHYRLQFSLLKENPVTEWKEDLQTLVTQYLGQFIRKVGVLAKFTIETQVIQYAKVANEVTPNANETEFYIYADDLKHFKSVNDFFDASVLDDGEQVLHFMAALPDLAHTPLYIRQDASKANLATSFELPGWGIVVILNSIAFNGNSLNHDKQVAIATTTRELQRVMGLFITEFRTLLGVASFRHRHDEKDATKITNTLDRQLLFLPSSTDGIADWELDLLMRNRFTKLLQTAIETLQSTVKLVKALPELSVSNRVHSRVEAAVTKLEAILGTNNCHETVKELHVLLAMARQASELTDAAYSDPTMIRQLYFPQDQMLGVYAPLLAPLLLPFLMGLAREYKRYQAKCVAKNKLQ